MCFLEIEGTQRASFVQQAQGYISVKDAATLMGVSVRSAYDYIAKGKLLATRVGNTVVVQEASARAYQSAGAGRPRIRTPIWRTP